MLFAFLHFHHIPLDWGGCLICPSLPFLCVKIAEESIMWTFMLIWGMGREREKSLEQIPAKVALGGEEGRDAGDGESSPLFFSSS